MKYDFSGFTIKSNGEASSEAARLFSNEIELRCGKKPSKNDEAAPRSFTFATDESIKERDFFSIKQTESDITVTAKTVRGLIYGYSRFLRKAEFKGETVTLVENIGGEYAPQKRIRGHQIGYRTTPNTYDAWDYDQYFRYYLDMMAFGANTCEHIPYEGTVSRRNALMKYDEEEFLAEASRLADEIDLDVSIWHPNCDEETEEEAVARREKLYSSVPRIDAVFPPGGDPGELEADVFIKRCSAISEVLRKSHPDAQMWPSAQAPHSIPDWGEKFVEGMNKYPDGIDGIIMGPNHAYPIFELRKLIPSKYPLRFYPDITHNLRCEYPVHFERDDWHFAFASTISREGVNPRCSEFSRLHRLAAPYTVGSVSYSEGVHDDVNKMVWSDLDFFGECDIRESLLDYARFFMPGSDAEKIADGILLLEKNWDCDPLMNPATEHCYRVFLEQKTTYTFLEKNWRFMLLYFRACCDMFITLKRKHETALIKDALFLLKNGESEKAAEILRTPLCEAAAALRGEIESLGGLLFELIGIQLDVEHYLTNSWERGATLDTIDNNITDLPWLLGRIEYSLTLDDAERIAFTKRLINRNHVERDEIYYSVALHGLASLGVAQEGEFYMNYQGDRPQYKKTPIPMSMTRVYDHFSLKARFGGFSDCDYSLKMIFRADGNRETSDLLIKANGSTVYRGTKYGGRKDEKFDSEMLAPGFESAEYTIKKEFFINGTLELDITEPTEGFEFCEIFIRKAAAE